MITRNMLRHDLPPDVRTDGYASVVLALCADHYFSPDGSNFYLPRWQTMTAVWYRNNAHLFEGWIELENIGPPDIH